VPASTVEAAAGLIASAVTRVSGAKPLLAALQVAPPSTLRCTSGPAPLAA